MLQVSVTEGSVFGGVLKWPFLTLRSIRTTPKKMEELFSNNHSSHSYLTLHFKLSEISRVLKIISISPLMIKLENFILNPQEAVFKGAHESK